MRRFPVRLVSLRIQRFFFPRLISRSYANIKDFSFRSYGPKVVQQDGGSRNSNKEPPSDRVVKLGRTIRILHERLPDLLASPLPQEIMAPNISLRLFPSTHPHLPSVSGRIAYTAALWTSPVAWGRMPVLGNVRLNILSERMHRTGADKGSRVDKDEKLVVRWQTCGKQVEGGKTKEEFVGLFIFEFDDQGRISSHTIENVEESNNLDKTPGFISVTDWLIGKAIGRTKDDPIPGLAFCDLKERNSDK